MTFIIFLIAVCIALVGWKSTFLIMWAGLFNILLAIYAAVMLTPTALNHLEILSILGPYACGAILLAIALAIFIAMQALTFRFLISDDDAPLPTIFNKLGSIILGLLIGWAAGGLRFLPSAPRLWPINRPWRNSLIGANVPIA